MFPYVRVLPLTLASLLLSTAFAVAQQGAGATPVPSSDEPKKVQTLPDAPAPQPSTESTPQDSRSRIRRFEDRMIAGRSLNVTSDMNAAPMSARDKFGLFVRESVDPGQFFLVGIDAGLSQASNEYSEYGQGAAGYGKRYGTALADEVSGEFFGSFLFPVILHEDPRYYRKGTGSFGSRVGWAMKKTFITRKDDGNWRFGYSRVLGNVAAGTLSNAYYPASDRGVGLTAQRAATITVFGLAGSLAQEFWPDISGKLLGHKTNAPGTVDSPAAMEQKAGTQK